MAIDYTARFAGEWLDHGGRGFNVHHPSFAGGATGDGVADDRAALAAADAAGPAEGSPGKRYRIRSALTLANGWRPNNSTLKPDSGVTVTINGPVEAGLYQWIDTSEGGTVAFGTGAVDEAVSHWFGAKGDGVTDDAAEIQAAIDAAGDYGRVHFPEPGAFYRYGTTLRIRSGQVWTFDGGSQMTESGTGLVYTGTGSAIRPYNADLATPTRTYRCIIDGLRLRADSAAVGLDMAGAYKWDVRALEIVGGNASGVAVQISDAGVTGTAAYYNSVAITGIGAGWGEGAKFVGAADSGMNSNRITGGGRIAAKTGVHMDAAYAGLGHNGNRIECNIEGYTAVGVYIENGVMNQVFPMRLESQNAGAVGIHFGSHARRNFAAPAEMSGNSGGYIIDDNTFTSDPNAWIAPVGPAHQQWIQAGGIELKGTGATIILPNAAGIQALDTGGVPQTLLMLTKSDVRRLVGTWCPDGMVVTGNVGFYGVGPVTQAGAIADLAGDATTAECVTAINRVLAAMRRIGMIAR